MSLPHDKLIEFANTAPFVINRPDGFPNPSSGIGSIDELRILYAVVRALNPILSLNLGTGGGISAIQIAAGSKDAPKPPGSVLTVDPSDFMYGNSKHKIGKFIPDFLNIGIVKRDAVTHLEDEDIYYEFIYEDTAHTFENTRDIYEAVRKHNRLVKGGVIMSHDAVHPKFKGAVVQGIRGAGYEPEVYLVDGSSCGLAIVHNVDKQESIEIATEIKIDYGQSTLNEIKTPKPKKRKARKRKPKKTETQSKQRVCIDCDTDISKVKAEGSIRTGRCVLCYKALIDEALPEHKDELDRFRADTEKMYPKTKEPVAIEDV